MQVKFISVLCTDFGVVGSTSLLPAMNDLNMEYVFRRYIVRPSTANKFLTERKTLNEIRRSTINYIHVDSNG